MFISVQTIFSVFATVIPTFCLFSKCTEHPFITWFCIRQGTHKPFEISSTHCQIHVTLFGVSLHVGCTFIVIPYKCMIICATFSFYDVPVFDNKASLSWVELSWVELSRMITTYHQSGGRFQHTKLTIIPAQHRYIQCVWCLQGVPHLFIPRN